VVNQATVTLVHPGVHEVLALAVGEHEVSLFGEREWGLRCCAVDGHGSGGVGAVDGAAALRVVASRGAEQVTTSPVSLGGGTFESAHGRFPVPAPCCTCCSEWTCVAGRTPAN
jgi:hypothetical protein